MDSSQALAAVTAIGALALPSLGLVATGARRFAAMRAGLPTARLGGIVLLCATIGGLARSSQVEAALAPITSRDALPATSPVAEARLPAVTGYVVVPGDSLWAISRRVLESRGEPATDAAVDRMWRSIYAANRQDVGSDPDLIFPGSRLTIPESQA